MRHRASIAITVLSLMGQLSPARSQSNVSDQKPQVQQLQVSQNVNASKIEGSDARRELLDVTQFIGNPIVGFLPYPPGTSTNVIYYAMVLPYNIPTPERSNTRYEFARFKAHLGFDQSNGYISNLRIFAIAPVNDFLTINHTSSNQVTATLEPQYAGMSMGSLQEQVKKEDQYQYGLPKTLSTISIDNSCSWIYYPQKNRPFAAGQKTAVIVFAIETTGATPLPAAGTTSGASAKTKIIQLTGTLEFKLRGRSRTAYQTPAISVDLGSAVALQDLTAIHSFDVPPTLLNNFAMAVRNQAKLETLAQTKKDDPSAKTPPPAAASAAAAPTQYVQDSVTGEVYLLDGTKKAEPVEFGKKQATPFPTY